MTLQEAIKSERPFRRPTHHNYLVVCGEMLADATSKEPYMFGPHTDDMCVEDLLADDWFLKEELITISREQFDEAFANVDGRFYGIEALLSGANARDDLWQELIK